MSPEAEKKEHCWYSQLIKMNIILKKGPLMYLYGQLGQTIKHNSFHFTLVAVIFAAFAD